MLCLTFSMLQTRMNQPTQTRMYAKMLTQTHWSPLHNFTEQFLPYTITDSHSRGHLVLQKILLHQLHVICIYKAYSNNIPWIHWYNKTNMRFSGMPVPYGWIHISPCWARRERSYREGKTSVLRAVGGWHVFGQSPKMEESDVPFLYSYMYCICLK